MPGRLQVVLLYLRYVDTRAIGIRFVLCAFVVMAEETGSKTKQTKGKKRTEKRGVDKNSLGIDPEKVISLSAVTG